MFTEKNVYFQNTKQLSPAGKNLSVFIKLFVGGTSNLKPLKKNMMFAPFSFMNGY